MKRNLYLPESNEISNNSMTFDTHQEIVLRRSKRLQIRALKLDCIPHEIIQEHIIPFIGNHQYRFVCDINNVFNTIYKMCILINRTQRRTSMYHQWTIIIYVILKIFNPVLTSY